MMENKSFEEKLAKLEEIINELESKELSLDKTVEKYKEGLELSKELHKELEKAQEIIKVEE